MLALLMLAVKYAQRDWSQKNQPPPPLGIRPADPKPKAHAPQPSPGRPPTPAPPSPPRPPFPHPVRGKQRPPPEPHGQHGGEHENHRREHHDEQGTGHHIDAALDHPSGHGGPVHGGGTSRHVSVGELLSQGGHRSAG